MDYNLLPQNIKVLTPYSQEIYVKQQNKNIYNQLQQSGTLDIPNT